MTRVRRDWLHLRGERLEFFALPLEAYFKAKGCRPEFQICTSPMRGYRGEWQIVDARLYLIGIEGQFADGSPVRVDSLFPGSNTVFADWYSKTVCCGQGQTLYYHPIRCLYERELIFEIKNGVVKSERVIENEMPRPGSYPFAPKE